MNKEDDEQEGKESPEEQGHEKPRAVPIVGNGTSAEYGLRLLIESAKDYAIFTLDAHRKVTSWSSGAQVILGYTEAEIIGRSGDVLFVPEDRQANAPEQEAQTAAEKGRAENERFHLRKDGSRFWGSGVTHPLHDEKGKLIGFVKIMRDLTAQRRQEEAKFFLASIVETSNDSVITIDFQRNITSWNKAAEYLYGYTAQEAIGRNLTMLTLPVDFVDLLAKVDAVEHNREVVVFDTVRHKKDGQLIDLEIVMSPVLNASGELVGISTIARDVTERKRREANLAFLAKINLGFAPLLTIQEVMEPVAEQLADYFQLNRCHFSLIDEQKDRVEVIYEYRRDENLPSIKSVQHISDKFTEEGSRYLSAGQLVVMNEVPDSPLVKGGARTLRGLGFGSLVYVPHLEAGRWRFLLTAGRAERSYWRKDELELLQELSSKIYIRIERARVEEALQKSEEKYRSLFETIDEGFSIHEAVIDDGGNVTDAIYREVNGAFETLTGMKNVPGKKLSEALPHLEQPWLDGLTHVYKTGEPLRAENYTADLARWFSYQYSRIGGPGSPLIAVVFNDITEQKQREQQQAFLLKFSDALRKEPNADALLTLALELLSEQLGLDRCYIGVYNLAADRADLTHQVGNDRVPPMPGSIRLSDFPAALKVTFGSTLIIDDVANKEGLTDTDRQNMMALGFGAFVAATLRKGENNPLWAIVGVSASPRHWTQSEIELMEEATERTWAAVERARAEEALRINERRLQRMMNVPRVGVLTFDYAGRLLSANDAILEMLGYTREEFDARQFTWLDFTPPQYVEVSQVILQQLKDTKRGGPYEKEYILKDGSLKWLMFVAADLGDGTIVEYAIDISERKKVEEDLRKSEERLLLATNAAKIGTFVYYPQENRNEPDEQMFSIFHLPLNGKVNITEALTHVIHPDDRKRYADDVAKAMDPSSTGKLDCDIRIIHPDGSQHWVNINAQVHFEGDPPKAIKMPGVATNVTLRKKAEETLRLSEKTFSTLVESAPFGVYLIDADFRLRTINEGARKVFSGINPLIGRDFAEILKIVWHEPFATEAIGKFRHTLKTGEPYVSLPITEDRANTGETESYDWQIHRLVLPDGSFGVVCYFYDLSHQKTLEKAVRESEARFRTLANVVPQVIWTNAADGYADYFNERWYAYSGLTYEQSKGLGWQAIVHPDDAPSSVEKWKKALDAGEVFDTEYRLRRHDGIYRWFIGRNVPLKDDSGKIKGWFGSATDIENLKKTEEALSQSEARLKITMESATDYAIITMDTDRRVERWSQGATQLFGYTESEMIGELADIIFTEEDRNAGGPQKEMETARNTGRAADERWHQRKDGSRFYASGVLRPIQNGELTGYVKVMRDMTQQKLFTEELQRLVAERTSELQRSNEDLRQFAHVASHDLKEPVRKIKTFNTRIIDEFSDVIPEKVKRYLEKIEVATTRMYTMIEGVLKYSKLSGSEQVFSVVDLNEIIEQVKIDLELLIQSKGATITTSGLIPIKASSILMHQLFYNLLINSLKFSKEGVPPIIKIAATKPEDNNEDILVISVSDNGIGFEPEFEKMVFNTFTRLNPTDEYDGTGLGLALCKKIVERHQGTIVARGKESEGATFIINLPVNGPSK